MPSRRDDCAPDQPERVDRPERGQAETCNASARTEFDGWNHWGFDPHATATEEEILNQFRRVRDKIKRVFEAYAAGLKEGGHIGAN